MYRSWTANGQVQWTDNEQKLDRSWTENGQVRWTENGQIMDRKWTGQMDGNWTDYEQVMDMSVNRFWTGYGHVDGQDLDMF